MKGWQGGVQLLAGLLGLAFSTRTPPDTTTFYELTGVNELTGLVLVMDDDVVLEHGFGLWWCVCSDQQLTGYAISPIALGYHWSASSDVQSGWLIIRKTQVFVTVHAE